MACAARRRLAAAAAWLTACAFFPACCHAAQRLNVLLVVCDDLRPQLGSYGHAQMKTPNFDKLASTGLRFERAYTNYAYCCPSRNSFMVGRMPGTSKVFNFLDSFRDATVRDRVGLAGTEWTTLPEHFKKAGYDVFGCGKLFHPGLPPDNDNPRSWSVNVTDPGGNAGCSCPESGVPGAPMYCELAEDTDCPDVVVADTVVQQLRAWKARNASAKFFAAVGIHKPHLPWGAPKSFFDAYPAATELPLAAHKLEPLGMPPVAYHHCQWGPFPWNSSRGHPVADVHAHEARRAYYAATSFADHLVGMVLDELESLGVAGSTVVLATSDHGWQLGEHNEWCKETVFELSLHIPFLIRDPLAAPGAIGGSTRVFAENIDIYRTLAELAGAPEPEAGVDGVSLAPLLRNPAAAGKAMLLSKPAAYGQHARCLRNATDGFKPIDPFASADSCTVTPRDALDWMGYSVRTDAWRYTAWVGWDGATLTPAWSRVNATELYAHAVTPGGPTDQDFDAWENENVAGRPENAAVVKQLHAMLVGHFNAFAIPHGAGSE